MEKKKLLFWGDSPTCATGFATVSRNVLAELYKTGLYDITIVGINYAGTPHKLPYDIYPASNALAVAPQYKNIWGMQLFVDLCGSGEFDIVFIIQDTFITQHLMKPLQQAWEALAEAKRFSLVYYFPIDATPKKEWITEVVSKAHYPVAYTDYAKRESVKLDEALVKMPVIYHGVNKEDFFPMDKVKAKKEFFEGFDDRFIVTNISRNQPRKDLHRTFAAFKVFHDKNPKSLLYILAQADDVGGNLIDIAKAYGLEYQKDWACPPPNTYGANQGYPIELVNKIYNASDLIVSTSLGEGFGLSLVEAMATKTPLLVPNNTAMTEIVGSDRGYLCMSGGNLNQFVCMGSNDNNLLRPTVDVYDMAEQMEWIFTYPEEAQERAENAYAWVPSWADVCKDWIKVFEKAWKVPQKFKYRFQEKA